MTPLIPGRTPRQTTTTNLSYLSIQVDRSAAYAARWVALSLVKAGLVRRVMVQLSYAIGIAEPLNITVFSHGTAKIPDDDLQKVVHQNFDLRPGKIVNDLNMKSPIYRLVIR